MSAQEKSGSTIKNIIAIIGFVVLLAIGIWSAIQVITFVPRLFEGDGVATTPVNQHVTLGGRDIAIALAPDTAASGSAVEIHWAHNQSTTEGVLSFSYACVEGFYFHIADRPVPCNAPYTLPLTDTSLIVVPVTTHAHTEAPLAITYTKESGESIRDTKTLIVRNESVEEADDTTPSDTTTDTDKEGTVTTTPTTTRQPIEPQPRTQSATAVQATYTPTPVVTTVKVPRQSNPYGTTDLAVEMVAIGEINQYGAFEHKHLVNVHARGAATFKVTNLGTKTSGPWYFAATLPTRGGYPYNSGPQPSLNPGSSTEIFVTFDQLVPGTHYFDVVVDPANHIYELSETNNRTGQALTVTTY